MFSHGPKVHGRAIERLLGHTVHICLLRRELLSPLRALYDFAYAMYARLFKLCSVDLRRAWSSDVTASDASLSGIAVCRRSLSAEMQSELGNNKEIWRYKSKVFAKPRDSALVSRDPFSL